MLFCVSQDTYLPYLLRSKVKLMLQGDDSQQSLLTFIDSSLKVPERKLHLEVRLFLQFAATQLFFSFFCGA